MCLTESIIIYLGVWFRGLFWIFLLLKTKIFIRLLLTRESFVILLRIILFFHFINTLKFDLIIGYLFLNFIERLLASQIQFNFVVLFLRVFIRAWYHQRWISQIFLAFKLLWKVLMKILLWQRILMMNFRFFNNLRLTDSFVGKLILYGMMFLRRPFFFLFL